MPDKQWESVGEGDDFYTAGSTCCTDGENRDFDPFSKFAGFCTTPSLIRAWESGFMVYCTLPYFTFIGLHCPGQKTQVTCRPDFEFEDSCTQPMTDQDKFAGDIRPTVYAYLPIFICIGLLRRP